jgi:hypothetical protein
MESSSDAGGPPGDAMTSSGDAIVDVPELDGDSPWIAFLKNQSLHLIRADGTGLQEVPTRHPPISGVPRATAGRVWPCPEWSPDGKKLAFVENRELVVFDVTDGSIAVLSDLLWNPRPRWSPDGRTVVVPSPEQTLHALDVTTGSATVVVADATGHDIAPDGALYFIRGQRERDAEGNPMASLHMLPSFDASEELAEALPLARADLLDVEAHPDRSRLLITATNVWEEVPGSPANGLLQYSPSTGEERRFGEPGDAAPSYFPDGSALVLARRFPGGNLLFDIVVTDLDGSLITRLTEDDEDNDVCPIVRPGTW